MAALRRRLEEKAVGTSGKENFHIDFGRELYNKVFSGKLGEYFKKCVDEAQKSGAGLRICLRFDENAQEIAALPWEFLHDGKDFLVTDRNTLISRLPSGVNDSVLKSEAFTHGCMRISIAYLLFWLLSTNEGHGINKTSYSFN